MEKLVVKIPIENLVDNDEVIMILSEMKDISSIRNLHELKTKMISRLNGINELAKKLIKKDKDERKIKY